MRLLSPLALGCLAAVVLSGCTGGSGRAPGSGSQTPRADSTTAWLTYRQPPGPMQLTFRYPSGWRAVGSTFVSSMGNVGQALVVGDTSSTVAEFTASRSCLRRQQLLHGTGVLISWGENIGGPSPIRLSKEPGHSIQINGYPAKLAEIRSADCEHRIINGIIQVAPRKFLFMHAEIGKQATTGTTDVVRAIFATAQP